MSLIPKIKKTIQDYKLFSPGETVAVGVSGGPDSMVLLHVLLELRREWGISVHVVHINHGLRKSAAGDQKFVKNFSQQRNIPFSAASIKIKAKKGRSSIEESAREQRLEFLFQTARKNKIRTIALGHTENDLAETVLMRIMRGTGLHGLQSILPKRTFSGLTVIRPLIKVTRKEIMKYLKTHKIPFRTDPTNFQTKFFRNKIRLQLIPVLEKYNPGINHNLANLASNTAVDYDFLSSLGEGFLQKALHSATKNKVVLKLNRLKTFHPCIQKIVVRQAVELLAPGVTPLTTEHVSAIEQLLEKGSSKTVVQLPGNKIHLKADNMYCTVFVSK